MVDQEIKDIIDNLPKLQQRQYSTNDQMAQLHGVAIKFGLYDAADLIKEIIIKNEICQSCNNDNTRQTSQWLNFMELQ